MSSLENRGFYISVEQMMPPPEPGRHRPQTWELVAAFVFGVMFVAIMLTIAILIPRPTEFQIFIFRVVVAMAAAGIGGVVPGFIVINIAPYIRAGGAIALFVIIYWFNPPALATGFTPFEEALQRAEAAFAVQNHSGAISFFDKARQARPKSWKPYYGLGRVEFQRGNFAVSLDHFKKAFELQGKTDGSLAYAIAMTQDSLSQFEEAQGSLLLAATLLPSESQLALDVLFDRGLINLILWLNRDAPKDTQRYRDAAQEFKSFLERGGFPRHWAHYHLACLKSRRAEDVSLAASDLTALRREANDLLRRAVEELASYTSVKAPLQRDMMRNLLRTHAQWSRKPGGPVACPSLIRSWTQSRGQINALIAALG